MQQDEVLSFLVLVADSQLFRDHRTSRSSGTNLCRSLENVRQCVLLRFSGSHQLFYETCHCSAQSQFVIHQAALECTPSIEDWVYSASYLLKVG